MLPCSTYHQLLRTTREVPQILRVLVCHGLYLGEVGYSPEVKYRSDIQLGSPATTPARCLVAIQLECSFPLVSSHSDGVALILQYFVSTLTLRNARPKIVNQVYMAKKCLEIWSLTKLNCTRKLYQF